MNKIFLHKSIEEIYEYITKGLQDDYAYLDDMVSDANFIRAELGGVEVLFNRVNEKSTQAIINQGSGTIDSKKAFEIEQMLKDDLNY